MTKVVIARAEAAALPACFALLPELAAPEAVMFTARDPDGTLAGAGGMIWHGMGEPAGLGMLLHVLPDRRRRGVGRALFGAMAALARGETANLWSLRPIAAGEEAEAFVQAIGFVPTYRQFHYETDAARFLDLMASLVERLRARNRIPAEVAAVPPRPDMREALVSLIRRELPTAPPAIDAMLRSAEVEAPESAGVDFGRSRVLLVGDEIGGALLSRRTPDGRDSKIVCNVVAPAFRKSWANALLLESTTRAGVEGGCVRFGFDCAETTRDTIGLAERSEADLVRTDVYYRYAAAAAAD